MSLRTPTAPRPPQLRGLSAKPPSLTTRRPEAAAKRPEGAPGKEQAPGVPQWWVIETGGGSYPEFLVWKWLADKGYKPGIDFQFQSSYFGGRRDLGGLVADFIVDALTPPLVIRVQGEYWHGARGGAQSRDDAESILLRANKWRVVDAWTNDILHRLDWVVDVLIGRAAY